MQVAHSSGTKRPQKAADTEIFNSSPWFVLFVTGDWSPILAGKRRDRGFESLSTFADRFAISIKTAKSGDILAIAGEQTKLLAQYHEEALGEAKRAFWFAVVTGTIGIAFFVGAVLLLLFGIGGGITTVSVLAGAIVEVISGVSLSVYAGARRQLFAFLQVLERMQRFLLAYEMCDSLAGTAQEEARLTVISTVVGASVGTTNPGSTS